MESVEAFNPSGWFIGFDVETYHTRILHPQRYSHVEMTDVQITFAITAVLLLIRAVLNPLVFRPIAVWAKGTFSPTPEEKADVEKFVKYLWHFVAYAGMWGYGIQLYMQQPFAWQIEPLWTGYMEQGEEKLLFKNVLMVQTAWYMHGFVESLLVDSKRNDFVLMLAHHFLAVSMIAFAFWGGAHRIAFAVVNSQDISDIVMYGSKMLQKSKRWELTQQKWFHSFLLTCLTISWMSTRVFLLGAIVIKGLFIAAPLIFNDYLSTYLFCQLTVFWGLQLLWATGLLKMWIDQIVKGTFHDMFHDQKKTKKKQ